MGKNKEGKWSWLQFLVTGPVAFGFCYVLYGSMADAGAERVWVSLAVGLGAALLAGRFGSSAWHLLGDVGSSM